jgi:hypothetical protein
LDRQGHPLEKKLPNYIDKLLEILTKEAEGDAEDGDKYR